LALDDVERDACAGELRLVPPAPDDRCLPRPPAFAASTERGRHIPSVNDAVTMERVSRGMTDLEVAPICFGYVAARRRRGRLRWAGGRAPRSGTRSRSAMRHRWPSWTWVILARCAQLRGVASASPPGSCRSSPRSLLGCGAAAFWRLIAATRQAAAAIPRREDQTPASLAW